MSDGSESPPPTLFEGVVPIEAPPDETAHYFGHRQRLRTRLLAQGAQSFADYEILRNNFV